MSRKHSHFVPVTGSVVRVADPFSALERQVGRLFNDYKDPALNMDQNMGPLDIIEDDKGYQIYVEVPGCKENDIEISASDGVLKISGEKKEPQHSENAKHHVSGRSFSSFEEEFTIPDDANADQISASLKDGVLKISMPHKPETKPEHKTIKIKSE